jgi:hypothetical protein
MIQRNVLVLIEPKIIIYFLNNEITVYVVTTATWKNLV